MDYFTATEYSLNKHYVENELKTKYKIGSIEFNPIWSFNPDTTYYHLNPHVTFWVNYRSSFGISKLNVYTLNKVYYDVKSQHEINIDKAQQETKIQNWHL